MDEAHEEQGENYEPKDTNGDVVDLLDGELPPEVISSVDQELDRVDQLHAGVQDTVPAASISSMGTEQPVLIPDQQSQPVIPPEPPPFEPPADPFGVASAGYGLSGGLEMSSPSDPFGVSSPSEGLDVAAPRISRRPKTLEDLYSSHREIGNGSTFMRVHRITPKRWGNMPIAGFLGDVHQQFSMNEFAERYGGGKYAVHIMGPNPSARLDDGGNLELKRLNTIEIELPGQPKMVNPTTEDDNMGWGRQAVGMPGPEPQVRIKEMDLAAAERARYDGERRSLYEQLSSTRSMDPDIISQITSVSEKRADEAKQANAEQITELRATNLRKDERLEEKDNEVQRLRERILQIQQDTALKMKQDETEEIGRLKEHHKDEISRMNAEHSRTVERMSQEHKDMVAEMNRRHGDERRQYESQQSSERERSRDEMNRREKQMSDDSRREKEHQQQMYESRLQEMERSHKREIDALRDQRNREVVSVQQSADNQKSLSDTSGQMQVNLLTQQLSSKEAEIEALSRENTDLRAKINKPVMEVIQEAHTLTDMTRPQVTSGDDEMNWQKGLMQVAKSVVEKAPEVAKQFGEAREANRMKARMQQMQSRPSGQPLPQGGYSPQPPMMGAPQHHPAMPQPAWVQSPGPPEPGTSPGMPIANSGPIREQKSRRPAARIGSPTPQGHAVVPISGDEHSSRPTESFGFTNEGFTTRQDPAVETEPEPQPEQQAPQQTVPQAPQVPQAPPTQGGFEPNFDQPDQTPVAEVSEDRPNVLVVNGVEIQMEQIDKFVTELNGHIEAELITPEQFAQGFIEQIGVEKANAIIEGFEVEALLTQLSNNEQTSHLSIVKEKGQKFTREVWEHAKSILSQ